MNEISERIIDKDLGGGRVKLYKTSGAPNEWPVVNALELEATRWLLVLLPERVGFANKTRAGALSRLRKYQDDTEINFHLKKRAEKVTKPRKKKGPVRARVHEDVIPGVAAVDAPKVKKERAFDRLKREKREAEEAAKAKVESPPEPPPPDEPEDKEKGQNIPKFAEGTSFDDALNECFSLERLMQEIEGLISASEPIFSKDGDHVGERPNYQARATGIKMLIEYREGKAREREKAQEKAKRITFDELKKRLLKSEGNCKGLEALIAAARKEREEQAKAAS